MGFPIGVDLGTSVLKTACPDPSGRPVTIPNSRGDQQTPSVVWYGSSGEVLVGIDAIEQGALEPTRCIRNFKLKLGSTENLLSDGQVVTPTDAAATLIRYAKETAERHLGMEVCEVVATCPANFRDDSKQALLEAYERNGLKVLKLYPEPTAAGLAYANDKGGVKYLAVFDFGGGTFDVSIICREGDQFTVISTDGIPHLGGNDLSACLMKRVLDAFEATFKSRPTPQSDPLLHLELEQRVERAKLSLNSRKEVVVVLGHKGQQLTVTLSQEEFHKDIDRLVRQTFDALDRSIQAAGLTRDKIDRLVMVGGTSNIRYIQERLADHTGLVPRMDVDPVKAVAYGAALAGGIELAKAGRKASFRGQVIPTSDAFVRDVTAHDVGCCVVDNAGAKRRLIQSVIIPKNTPIPCQKVDSFFLEFEDQKEAQIEILQGEAEADRDSCLLIGELTLTDLPPEPKRTARITVQYIIDGNGMVTATATDKVSGQQQTVSVDYKKGVKPQPKPSAA